MRPLIEIQTIPIEIQMKTTNAHLEYARGTAQMEVSRDDAGSRSAASPFGSTLILLRRAVLSSPPPPRAFPAGGAAQGTACGIRGYRRPGAGGPHDDGGQN